MTSYFSIAEFCGQLQLIVGTNQRSTCFAAPPSDLHQITDSLGVRRHDHSISSECDDTTVGGADDI